MVTFNFKKFVAIAMASVMVVGGSVTAFAADNQGAGTFEGADPSFPTFSLTLPTTPATDLNYIADPNGLISVTNSARYADATWSNTAQGIFFANTAVGGKTPHSEKSNPQKAVNNNYNGAIITVKLEEVAAVNGTTCVASNEFKDTDTDKEVYFALTDGEETTAGLTTAAPAEMKFYLAGKPSNYTVGWNTTSSAYEITAKETLADYNSKTLYVVGALNKNATWADGSLFPTIKITWNFTQNASPVKVVKGATAKATLATTAQKTISSVTIPAKNNLELSATQCPRTNPDGTAAATITLSSAITDGYYSLFASDGLNVKVTYSDKTYEYVTFVQ